MVKKKSTKKGKKNSNKSTRSNSKSKSISSKSKKIIFLDNNGTTLICPEAAEAFKKWLACYNPSSSSKTSSGAAKIMEAAQKHVLKHCGTSMKEYTAIFTSGATESNCFIIRSTVEAYRKIRNVKPHLIISEIEHHSVLECGDAVEEAGYAEVTRIKPNMYGCINPADIEAAIQPNTCLISIMYANNETGAINNIPKIGEIAHKHKIPMHTDAVQIFGKFPINVKKSNIDAMSASFHKLYGPKGIGLLLLNNDFIQGYDLKGQICGSQQGGLRGGTENIPGIASSIECMKSTFRNRTGKNAKLLKMRNYILDSFEKSKHVSMGDYKSYLGDDPVEGRDSNKPPLEIVLLGPPRDKPNYHLPNTILMSIAKNKGKPFCNVKFKKKLDDAGLVVSISSACLTSSDKASHVLTAMDAPPVIKRGVLRISMGDTNTMEEVRTFTKKFMQILLDFTKIR